VPAGHRRDALQSLVDLPTSFLAAAGIPKPRPMVGVDQIPVWCGQTPAARDHIVVENHHQPTTIHVKTYVNDRYKLTTYFNQPYGELFDLQADPGEVHNRWDDPASRDLKMELLQKLLFAELAKEPLWMPRISGA
jgi:arylsulfatase A-like enzyme